MTTTIVPVSIEMEAARIDPVEYSIVIDEAEVVVTNGEVAILTAEVREGFIYGVVWTAPPGCPVSASARSTLIGRVQQHVLIAESRRHAETFLPPWGRRRLERRVMPAAPHPDSRPRWWGEAGTRLLPALDRSRSGEEAAARLSPPGRLKPGRHHPYFRPDGPMDPLHLALAVVLAALWLGAVAYSRHRWPYLGCRSCRGTGKKREPVILAALCFRVERAWRPCPACSGGGKRERPKGLALR